MNICFIGSLDYPGQLQYRLPTGEVRRMTLDGGVRRVLPLLKHVQKRGHRVIMVIPTMTSPDKHEVYDNFPIYHLGPNNWPPFKSSFYLSGSSLATKTFTKARKLVKTHDIDIIYSSLTLICGPAGWFAAKLCHKPLVLEYHDLIMQFGIEIGQFNPKSLLTKFGLFVQNNLPRRADMVVATNFIGRMLISQGMPSGRVIVIPMAADISAFHPGIDGKEIRGRYGLGDSIVILYQGAVYRAFGIGTLIEAMSKVSQKNKDVKLLIVGFHRNREIKFEQDEEIVSFKRRVEQLGIKDKVVFTGPQPHEAIPNFVAASDICVNPAPYTIAHRAGSPGKVFEYMAVGKPVVSTALESVEDVVIDGETGLLAKPDAEDITEKILWLVENPSARARLGKNAREKVVAEYEWEKLGDKLINAFQRVMKNRVK